MQYKLEEPDDLLTCAFYNASFYYNQDEDNQASSKKGENTSENQSEFSYGNKLYKLGKKGNPYRIKNERPKKLLVDKQETLTKAVYPKGEFIKALLSGNIIMKIQDQVDKKSEYIWEFKKALGDNFKTKEEDSSSTVPYHPDSSEWILFSDKYEIHEYQKAFRSLYKDLVKIQKNSQKQPGEAEGEGADDTEEKGSKTAVVDGQPLAGEVEETKETKDDSKVEESKSKKKKYKEKQASSEDPTKGMNDIEFEYSVKRPGVGRMKYKGQFTKAGIKNLYNYISAEEWTEEGVNIGLYVTLGNNKTREVRWFDSYKTAGFEVDPFKDLRMVVEKEEKNTQEFEEDHPLYGYSFEKKGNKAFDQFFKIGVDA